MAPTKSGGRIRGGRWAGAILVVLIFVGLAWELSGGEAPAGGLFVRSVRGFYLGQFPGALGISDPVNELLRPARRNRLMTVRHIPRIQADAAMPHPFVGNCTQCHLYRGGPGNQPTTPLGGLSKVKSLGPPLYPDSGMPHPPAGRCIKCHDIVVKDPVRGKKPGHLWTL